MCAHVLVGDMCVWAVLMQAVRRLARCVLLDSNGPSLIQLLVVSLELVSPVDMSIDA